MTQLGTFSAIDLLEAIHSSAISAKIDGEENA